MNRKYAFHPGQYELGENEKFYGDMEARGWRLEKRGGTLSRFRRVEPSRARYRVEVYTPPFLEQSVLPEEQIAVFADCGWEYVADCGSLHIFRAPEGSAAPEFYDDPAQQAATLRKARRDMWTGLAVSLVLLVLSWLYFALLSGISGDRFRAQFILGMVQSPGVILAYGFWLLWGLERSLREAWKINRTYRRLKRGLPLDHNPRRGRPLAGPVLLGLALACLLLAAGQFLTRRSGGVPARPDGPYILLEDLGWEGTPGRLFYREPGVIRTWSPLADYWETCEIVDLPGSGQVWMYQDVYRLRFPGMMDDLAWALMEDAVFSPGARHFREISFPGLDRVWTTGSMELVAVKGNLAVYVEFLASGSGHELDTASLCAALAERWGQG